MKHIPIIIIVIFLIAACGNSNGGKTDVPIDGGHGIGIDTATMNENLRYDDSLITVVSAKESPRTVLSSSSQRELHEPDNMRGFDPASEDDRDDNGMTRYMEVNDEEGWE